LVPLERLFDINDVATKVEGSTAEANVSECNIGMEQDPKWVKMYIILSREKRDEYVRLMKEFTDVFTWTYEYLRTYDTSIIECKIPLKEDAKPFKQELRQINPMLLSIMEKEVKKILDAHIIIPLIFLEWVANLVLVRKKNEEI